MAEIEGLHNFDLLHGLHLAWISNVLLLLSLELT